jgi:hypothetical protein
VILSFRVFGEEEEVFDLRGPERGWVWIVGPFFGAEEED